VGVDAAGLALRIQAAAQRIGAHTRRTPLERSPFLGADSGAELYLKLENQQITQSFKARGAFNALLSLDAGQRSAGVVTSSTGNHANAMAHALALTGIAGEIWVPATIAPVKRAQLEGRRANLRVVEGDPGAVEVLARAEAERSGRVYVSPYNDLDVIAGQGTVAAEVFEQAEAIDEIVVPVGGGGLIAGIAAWVRAHHPRVRVTGVLPANSPVMSESVRAGRLLEIPWSPSLSDATVGWAEPGAITFSMCRDWVDDWLLVTEAQIREAIRTLVGMHSMLVEGAGALSTAAVQAHPQRFAGKRVVLVVSGARIPPAALAEILAEG
jgi:threonine dehydratase